MLVVYYVGRATRIVRIFWLPRPYRATFGASGIHSQEESMLKTKLLHPENLQALGSSGHGAQMLIADGNYPFSTGAPPGARRVYLNLAKDMLGAVDVLKVLAESVMVEKATVMLPADGEVPEIFQEFADVLGAGITFTRLKRFEFYDEAKADSTCLVIATGESRRFANILLTIGVVK